LEDYFLAQVAEDRTQPDEPARVAQATGGQQH